MVKMIMIIIVIRVFMTNIMIIVIMEELITTTVTVIMVTYRRNSIERRKLDLMKKLVKQTRIEIFFIINIRNTRQK